MRVCLIAVGSRGDVAPYLTLGRELTRRGHHVRVVVLSDYSELVCDAGLEPVVARTRETVAMWPENRWLRRMALAQPGVMYAMMRRAFASAQEPLASAVELGVEGCDVVVTGAATRALARAVGARRQAPVITLLMAPLLPSSRHESGVLVPRLGGPAVGRGVSEAMWRLTNRIGPQPPRGASRRVQGSRPDEVVVCAVSETVCPRGGGSAGGRHVVWTGWLPSTPPDRSPVLDEGLDRFLQRPGPAVLMGFGSCPSADPCADVELFRRVAKLMKLDLVLQTPLFPAGLVSNGVWNAPGVDHQVLLPRVAAIVHHGGAGTTMTALASGVPSVVVPHLGDQRYFAQRVSALGAGVAAPPRWRLRQRDLERGLSRVLQPGMSRRAQQLGSVITCEAAGATEVALILEGLASRTP